MSRKGDRLTGVVDGDPDLSREARALKRRIVCDVDAMPDLVELVAVGVGVRAAMAARRPGHRIRSDAQTDGTHRNGDRAEATTATRDGHVFGLRVERWALTVMRSF